MAETEDKVETRKYTICKTEFTRDRALDVESKTESLTDLCL